MAVELVIVGDEAWTPEEWEARQREREADRRYRQQPHVRDRQREYYRQWVSRNRERVNAYKREWKRRQRSGLPTRGLSLAAAAGEPVLVGSLHSLSCTGPTSATGCVCNRKGTRKIRCYSVPR